MLTEWVTAFVLTFSMDWFYSIWARRVAEGSAVRAGLNAGAMYGLGALAVKGWIDDPLLLIPAVLGAAAGTVAATHWDVKRNEGRSSSAL